MLASMDLFAIIYVALPSLCAAILTIHTSIFSIRFIQRCLNEKNGYREHSKFETAEKQLYEDEDGVATEESQEAYKVKFQKITILVGALVGTCLQALVVIMTAANGAEKQELIRECLFGLSWISLSIQATCLRIERCHAKTFHQTQDVFWLTLILLLAQVSTTLIKIYKNGCESMEFGLACGNTGAATLVLVTSLLIPRRPSVYFNGKLVDDRRSTNLLSRYTYHWAHAILQKAVKKGKLEEIDIPFLNRAIRAERLIEEFNELKESPQLYWTVVQAHKWTFIRQYIITILGTATAFTPPLIMSQVLKTLERRDAGEAVGPEGYFWVCALGLIKLIETILLAHIYWLNFMGLLIPIRNQLSAVVFSKTIRKKDVKGSQKEKTENQEPDGTEDDELNMKQGTINLLAVDSERVALFCGYSGIILESICGALFGFGFIVFTLGWQSLVAGLLVVVFTTPGNIYFSKKYSDAQDDLMKIRDKKMAVISESLQGIRQIKFSAMEGKWEERIRVVREEELKILRRVFIADVMVITAWIINPIFLSAFALSTYAVIHGSMSPSIAFPSLAIFGELEWSLSVMPELVTNGFDAIVSINRIKRYLDSGEKKQIITDAPRIAMVDATVAWAADSDKEGQDRFCLRNLDLEFPMGELSIISGRTGSGKSLLLNSFLGEGDLLSGRIEMPAAPNPEERFDHKANGSNWILSSAVAFVAQIPWIESGTIQENILFGLPFDRRRYEKVIHACALEKDLETLEDGDSTEIGANGINLSGGQRWRISFARAVYSRAGILVLDDIFSAVDAHVGKHIFENGLTGELMRGRTRILVTHHLRLCVAKAAYTVILSNGAAENAGSTVDLRERGVLERIIDKQENPEDHEDEGGLELTRTMTKESTRSRKAHVPAGEEPARAPPRIFVEEEEIEKGAVKLSVYTNYIKASGGWWIWGVIILLFVFQEALVLGRNFWVKIWTSQYAENPMIMLDNAPRLSNTLQYSINQLQIVAKENHDLAYWIGIYIAISLVACIIGSTRYAYIFSRSLVASRVLFEDMLSVVMRAPLRWLDTVPTGRILNRFSKDFETIDSRLISDMAYLIWNSLGLVGVNLAAAYLSPYILGIAILGLIINLRYAMYYLAGAREVKRLESNSRSPIFEFFSATLTGVATVRAFGRSQEYISKMFSRLDTYSQRTYYVWLFNRWIGIRMSWVGTIFVALNGFVVVAIPSIDASLAGFALSFSLNYTANVVWTLRRYANVELNMNSMERIVEYNKLPTESQDGVRPPAAWPTDGRIEVDNLHVSYAPNLPPVLKGVTFSVAPRERVGIVGRTGAGKSSLTLTLFQFIRASQGTIHIDGLDISKLRLHDLRSRLAIIPQDPVLFSGTIRSNLDPFGEYTDVALAEALARIHLTSSAASDSGLSISSSGASESSFGNIFRNLDSSIAEGGLNLSQGQRQLLCLARAIVVRPKILVLDEATSAVDLETDSLIQMSIREEFTDATTLVIAHRLATVVDYDRILVLGDGRVLEYGSPEELLDKKGDFWEMVQQTGEAEHLEAVARRAGPNRR